MDDFDLKEFELNERRHLLNVERFEDARVNRKHDRFCDDRDFHLRLRNGERTYTNELFEIIKYLNRIKDDVEITTKIGNKEKHVIVKGRELNPHEEDIYNYALITLKKLIKVEPINFKPVETKPEEQTI